MNGEIHRFFTTDHRRIEGLLEKAIEVEGKIKEDFYHPFRVGLLTHIKMEEKILFKAAAKANGGKPLPMAKQLRLDHGAITALLVVPPTAELIKVLQNIMEIHDEAEEKPGGMYDLCETLTQKETDMLMEKLKNTTEVPVHPPNPIPLAMQAARRAVERAGYDFEELAK